MIKFEKYHGLGNDFVIFNYNNLLNNGIKDDEFSKLALKACNRHTGIGADGIMILVDKNDRCQMIFINSDGSIGEMCGNGIRCFSNYIYNNNILEGTTYRVETLSGLLTLDIFPNKELFSVKVNMGTPTFETSKIPMSFSNNSFLDKELEVYGETYRVSAILMGVPHAVVFVEDLKNIDIEKVGKYIENHELFPAKINVNFVELVTSTEIKIDTWERGAGHTLACGTGSCASVIVGKKLGLLDGKVIVHLNLGDLEIEVGETVFMTGPAELIAKGEYLK
ncbi:MAG: diaminopimelate epimerase [Psychrilyobacter sp.]|nr:diaminopimelate epimerase [Psychrilyobacter sp.]